MTAKFYNAKEGTILDFTNDCYGTGHTITEQNDMYYQVDIDKRDYSYRVFSFNGTKGSQKGITNTPIKFYERGGGNCFTLSPTPTPTITPTNTPTPTPTPTPTNGSGAPTASFSTSIISAFRSGTAGTTTETSSTTITVINGTVTIKLKSWVIIGYRSDTSITIGLSSYSPDFSGEGATPLAGTGEGNASYTTFSLGVGIYTITNWTVSAITQGSGQTIVQAKLEQVI
jgi:hypothetical protein